MFRLSSFTHTSSRLSPSLYYFELFLSCPLRTWASIVSITAFGVVFLYWQISQTQKYKFLCFFNHISILMTSNFLSKENCLRRGSSHIFITFWTCFRERLYKYFPKYFASLREGHTHQAEKLDKGSAWKEMLSLQGKGVQDCRAGSLRASPLLCYCWNCLSIVKMGLSSPKVVCWGEKLKSKLLISYHLPWLPARRTSSLGIVLPKWITQI